MTTGVTEGLPYNLYMKEIEDEKPEESSEGNAEKDRGYANCFIHLKGEP